MDCRLVWHWANDPSVRAVSFSKDDIPYDTHIRWFKNKLNDPNCVFYIADDRNRESIGLIRYNLSEDDATVSVIVDSRYKGQGYGSHIITCGSERIFTNRRVNRIHAYVLPQNKASVRAFRKANFRFREDTIVKGQPAKHFILTRKVQK